MGAIIHQSANWLNVSQGKMVNKKSGVSLDGWNGNLTAIKKREGDYNGEPHIDVVIAMTDGKENVLISFNAESPFARGFFARITKCDIFSPIEIGVMGWDDNGTRDKAVSLCFMRQGGVKVEPTPDFPNSQKVRVGAKTVSDWTDMNAATDKIMFDLQARLASIPKTESEVTAPAQHEEEEPPF